MTRRSEYLGYLLGIDNIERLADAENSLIWKKVGSTDPPIFAEVCTDTSRGLPKHPTRRYLYLANYRHQRKQYTNNGNSQ